tara:strand:- start:1224 stop:1751 length:528 start_codon:yes stop_codon:yes gene_type:complete
MNSTLAGTEEGLVGYWNFDDGTAKDLTTNGNDGEFKGDASIIEVPLAIIEIGNYKFVDPTKLDFENPEEVEAAVNALIQQLSQDPDANVRVSSAAALGQIGKEAAAAIPALTRAFQDQNYNVRISAVDALKSIGTSEAIKATEDAIPPLVEIQQDNNVPAGFHHSATRALNTKIF